jgi:hypothetical protein
MISRVIAQAIASDAGLAAHSDDFLDDWRPEVERIIAGFGLPANIHAPDCLFAVPFQRRQVAVVAVAGRQFRFLVLSRALYNVIPDPFAIVARFPPQWDKMGTLPAIEWPEETLPKRTVKQLDQIFKHGDGPFLLGACQTLVDSGKIALVRETPATDLFNDLWSLLPDSIRRQTWPATYAYSTALGFGLVALPALPTEGHFGYLTEDQTRDYPESRYERELQTAVENGDQQTVDRLFARRSTAETLRLAIFIVLGAAAISVATRVLMAW